jgi:hypothetical protein
MDDPNIDIDWGAPGGMANLLNSMDLSTEKTAEISKRFTFITGGKPA